MIAKLEQIRPIHLANPQQVAAERPTFRHALMAGAMGFFCFLPYVAIPLARSTAIQIGTLLGLVVLAPLTLTLWKRVRGEKLLWIFPLLMLPLAVAALKAGVTDGDDGLCIKTVPLWMVTLITILATQICAPRYSLELLTGIAVATVLHALVGAVQYVSFSHGEFPLTWLYVNPSFLSVQDNAEIIAKYTQRPFGMFPEPSAMSSSLAPWALFWIAEACGIVRLRRTPAFWQRVLFFAAAVGAIALTIVSRSGHAAVTMVAIVILIAIWFVRCKATARSYAAILLVFGVMMPFGLYFAILALRDRMGGASSMGNSSWEDRSDSLIVGWKLLVDGDLPTILFGLGPGMSSPMIERSVGLEAVWSVLLTYIYETGLLGAIVVCWIAQHLARIWKSVKFDVTFVLMFVVWLVGITITTSYFHMLTLWVTLGWFIVWPAICRPAASWERQPQPELVPLMPKLRAKAKWIPRGWRESVARAGKNLRATIKPPHTFAGWR